MNKISNKYCIFLVCLALVLTTLTAFWQVRHHEFVTFDDDLYIYDNSYVKAGLTRQGLVWAFTKAHAYNWHPLTWLSHMLDCELYGLDAGGHHFTNVLFHIANAVLLFLFLNRLTGRLWSSAFVAAAFALHPLHVESVAWASERKDVLSTLFWILTMWAYVRYAECPSVGRYLLVVLGIGLGLMAKQMLVTLPFVFLLLDYWPLGRLRFKGQSYSNCPRSVVPVSTSRCILEKVPLLVLSAAAAAMVYLVQERTGLVKSVMRYPLIFRIGNALVTYVAYIGRMFWPGRLAIFYPHLRGDLPFWYVVGALLLLVVITVLVLWKLRQRPYLALGWLWYVGTLVPVIGLVQVGLQASADRYTYVPLIGLFIIIAWGVPEILARLHYRKTILSLSSAVLLLVLGVITQRQVGHWHDNTTLYEHAVEVVENNWWAYDALGRAFAKQDKPEDAVKHFTRAIEIRPDYLQARCNLGSALVQQDKINEAIGHFTKVLQTRRDFVGAHSNLGYALLQQGRLAEAAAHFMEALRIKPDFVVAHQGMAQVLLQQGRGEEALSHYRRALRAEPLNPDIYDGLGAALAKQGKRNEAIIYFTKTLQLQPDHPKAHLNLGAALAEQGRLDEAMVHFTEALRINPRSSKAHKNIGITFFNQGRFEEAVAHFRVVVQIEPDLPGGHKNLADTLFQQGSFAEAITHYNKSLQIEPDFVAVHAKLAYSLEALGSLGDAVEHYAKALQAEPDRVDILNNLAWLLAVHKDAEFHDPEQAVRLAERACQLTKYEDPSLLDTLATAYEAAGDSAQAAKTTEKIKQLTRPSKLKDLKK